MSDDEKTIDELRRKYQIAIEALRKYRGREATEIKDVEIVSSLGVSTGHFQPTIISLGKIADLTLKELGDL